MATFELRKVERRDFGGLSSLYQVVYGKDLKGDFWEWKYFKNPDGETMMFIALDGANVIGEVGTIPVRIKCGDSVYPASQTCDITLHPDYHKGGPFLKLYKLTEQENKERNSLATYGFSVPVTLKISTKILKFRPVCPIWRWVLVLNPAPFLAKKIKMPFVSSIAAPAGRLYTRLRAKPHYRDPEGKIVEIDNFDSRFDRFWEKRKNDHKIMVVRDSGYLNWRYSENPAARYKTFGIMEGGELRAYTVLNIIQEELRRGFIMELMAEPGRPEMIDLLLSAALDFFYREKADVLNVWLPENHANAGVLERWGFIRKETPHNLIVRLVNEATAPVKLDYILDAANWYFTLGDSDYH